MESNMIRCDEASQNASNDRQTPDESSSMKPGSQRGSQMMPPKDFTVSLGSSWPEMFAAQGSPNDRTAPETMQAERNSCHCMNIALKLLEAFESRKCQPRDQNKNHILSLTKRAIAECNRMLDCDTCNVLSSFMILVIVVSQKVMSMLDTLTSMPYGHWDRGEDLVRPHSQGVSADTGKMMLDVLPLDTSEELENVFEVLEIRQCKDLSRLMGRLKSTAACWHWETHIAMIEPIELQLKEKANSGGRFP